MRIHLFPSSLSVKELSWVYSRMWRYKGSLSSVTLEKTHPFVANSFFFHTKNCFTYIPLTMIYSQNSCFSYCFSPSSTFSCEYGVVNFSSKWNWRQVGKLKYICDVAYICPIFLEAIFSGVFETDQEETKRRDCLKPGLSKRLWKRLTNFHTVWFSFSFTYVDHDHNFSRPLCHQLEIQHKNQV